MQAQSFRNTNDVSLNNCINAICFCRESSILEILCLVQITNLPNRRASVCGVPLAVAHTYQPPPKIVTQSLARSSSMPTIPMSPSGQRSRWLHGQPSNGVAAPVDDAFPECDPRKRVRVPSSRLPRRFGVHHVQYDTSLVLPGR